MTLCTITNILIIYIGLIIISVICISDTNTIEIHYFGLALIGCICIISVLVYLKACITQNQGQIVPLYIPSGSSVNIQQTFTNSLRNNFIVDTVILITEPKLIATKLTKIKSNDECTICYDNIKNQQLPCFHEFCDECIEKFVNKSCPYCRSQYV
jgi:hypothetical protein